MRNQYEKKCCWCKVVVAPQEGRVWNYNGRWYVGCQSCLDERKQDKEAQASYFFCTLTLGTVNTVPIIFCQIYFLICILYTI